MWGFVVGVAVETTVGVTTGFDVGTGTATSGVLAFSRNPSIESWKSFNYILNFSASASLAGSLISYLPSCT